MAATFKERTIGDFGASARLQTIVREFSAPRPEGDITLAHLWAWLDTAPNDRAVMRLTGIDRGTLKEARRIIADANAQYREELGATPDFQRSRP